MRALSSKTKGLWAAITTPWSDDGELDEGVLARNCHKLAAAKVDGIYTTDSDGEFYAIELDEFRQLARVFSRAMEQTKIDAAMGVTWTNTRGIIDRIKVACDAGVPNVHVAFPYFVPLATPDVDRFFADIAAAAPQARWIHYAHPSAQPTLTGRDYARIAAQHRQLIGTKVGPPSLTDLTEILVHSPELAHTSVDTSMVAAFLLGAVGVCSYWCNTLPRWHRRFVDACLEGRWNDAVAMHRKFMKWELTEIQKARALGHRHGIISKLRGSFSGFLEDSGHTRAPYYPIDSALAEELRRAFRTYWADELAAEQLGAATA